VGACVVGARVSVSATISYQDGRLIRFDVMAETASGDEVAPVRLMQGSMTRVVVDRQRFMAKLV
jgi:predicted thioesterase